MKKKLNQKLIGLVEYYQLINANFFLSLKPINRMVLDSTDTFTFNGTTQHIKFIFRQICRCFIFC